MEGYHYILANGPRRGEEGLSLTCFGISYPMALKGRLVSIDYKFRHRSDGVMVGFWKRGKRERRRTIKAIRRRQRR